MKIENGMNGSSNHALAPYLLRPPRRWQGTLPPAVEGGVVQDVLGVFRRQWMTIVATIGVLVAGTVLYCLIVTPTYLGQSTVLIEGKGPQVASLQDAAEAQSPFQSSKYDYYQTQFTLLRSSLLVKRVIQELDLAHDPRFATSTPANAASSKDVPPTLVAQYLKNLVIFPVRGTRLVYIQYMSPDANLSADVANAHARLFVRIGMERLYNSMDQIRTFLQAKLGELQEHMQIAEANLAKFQSAHKMMPIDVSKDVASERLVELSRRLTTAEGERIALEAQYNLVEHHEYDSLPAVLASPLIQKLREDTDRLDVEHALLAMKFRPTYPKLRELSGQLDHAHKLLQQETAKVVAGVEASYRAAQGNVDELKTELDAQRQLLLDRKDAEGEFLTLVREVDTTRAIHDNLLSRIKNLNVSGEADTSNISIAEPASAPTNPYAPAWKLDLILSFATGLLLGCGLAFLRDASDRRIRDSKDIHAHTGLGTLAVVPDFGSPIGLSAGERLRDGASRMAGTMKRLVGLGAKNGNGNGHHAETLVGPPVLVGNGSVPPPAEAFRTLRTSLLLSRASSPRVILIASAMATEGKTTTAVNTAAALATCGATVLLIDGDLRMPRCHVALGVPDGAGLTDYLQGDGTTLPIRPTHIANLSLLAAGQPAANPSELLTSWKLCKLLQDARERYDFVVFDSPPLLVVSDGLLLANLSDGVVVVTEKGKSRTDHVRMALQRLQQAGAVPLGAVLNRGRVDMEYYRYSAGIPIQTVEAEVLPPASMEAADVEREEGEGL